MAKEIWFTTTAKGNKRAWFFSTAAFRAMPMKMADAELGLMTGTLTEIAKPGIVGK